MHYSGVTTVFSNVFFVRQKWMHLICIVDPPRVNSLVSSASLVFSPGPWFNTKMSSYQYRRSHSAMGFPILVRRHLYIESGPRALSVTNSPDKLYTRNTEQLQRSRCRHRPNPPKLTLKYEQRNLHNHIPCPNLLDIGLFSALFFLTSLITRFMGPIWGPFGAARTQMSPMLAPWTMLSGTLHSCSMSELKHRNWNKFVFEDYCTRSHISEGVIIDLNGYSYRLPLTTTNVQRLLMKIISSETLNNFSATKIRTPRSWVIEILASYK